MANCSGNATDENVQPTLMDIQLSHLKTNETLPMIYIYEEIDISTKEFLTPEEAIQGIKYFDGENMDPFLFIDLCKDASDKINPLDIQYLTNCIRSKIIGEAEDIISQTELNYDDIMLEFKRVFVLKHEKDFVFELSNQKQKLYENLVRFGKRLLNILQYYKESMSKSKVSGDMTIQSSDLKTMEKLAIRVFIENLRSTEFKMALQWKQPNSITEAIKFAEHIWNFNNALYEAYPFDLLLFENTNCLYCENRKLHCHECPFQDKLDINTLNVRRIIKSEKPYENQQEQVGACPFLYDEEKYTPLFYHYTLEFSGDAYEKLKSSAFKDLIFRKMFEKNMARVRLLFPDVPPLVIRPGPYKKACKNCRIREVIRLENLQPENQEYCKVCYSKLNLDTKSQLVVGQLDIREDIFYKYYNIN